MYPGSAYAQSWLNQPDFELYSALGGRVTNNALQTPLNRKFDGFATPVTGLIATGKLWSGATYRIVGFYSAEIYQRQKDGGFNRFSTNAAITQKFDDWSLALNLGRRRTYDQPLMQLNSDAWSFGIALSRPVVLNPMLTLTPVLSATRRINVPFNGASAIPLALLDRTEAGQNGMIYRGAVEIASTSGDWTLTVTPDISRTINNPLLSRRTTETLVSLDVALMKQVTKLVTVGLSFSTAKAFSNDPAGRYRFMSLGPGVAFTLKF